MQADPPNEAAARRKYDCPACGAEARWDPAQLLLICPYCATVSPASKELTATGEELIREQDLAAALRQIPDSRRGWQAPKTSVRCQSCQAISVFDPERVGQRCDFCGSSALLPHEQIKDSFQPESLLPMQIDERTVRENLRRWYASRWFAPNRFKRAALTDTLRGVYIPYWTFDAQADAQWTAESGYYYYETETYTDAKGNTQTRQVRNVRWVPASGRLSHAFDDELVPASKGVHGGLLRQIEPFPTRDLATYNPGFLAGWVVERYQIDLVTAATAARQRMDAKLRDLCARQVPGDTHRGLAVNSAYSHQTFKHILVPIWLVTYDYSHKSFQVVVNASTGSLAGEYPKSWLKIFFLIATIAAIVVIVAAAAK